MEPWTNGGLRQCEASGSGHRDLELRSVCPGRCRSDHRSHSLARVHDGPELHVAAARGDWERHVWQDGARTGAFGAAARSAQASLSLRLA